jgi:hypothetical protein
MTVPEDWVNPLRGYAYDSFNRDVLLNRATVRDGRMTLPGGASYKVVVLPLPRPMNPDSRPLSDEVQAKIEALRKGGVVIPALPYEAEDFAAYGLERDVIVPAGVAWTHRRGDEADIYFIANQTDKRVAFEASLRIHEGRPQLWHPVTGEVTGPVGWTREANRTVVPLTLDANESVFIVFPKDDAQALEPEDRKLTKAIPLEVNAWQVDFPAIGRTVTRAKLFDWSRDDDERIRYYSGTATYTASFEWKGKPEGRAYLTLGEVANVATVRVNGLDCGTIWTAPYRADITRALKKGVNTLEISVSNTWANALNGLDQGKAPFDGIWTNGKYRRADRSLLPAGLLGPTEVSVELF